MASVNEDGELILFDGSVRDNIAYGSEGATDEQIIEAAKKVKAQAPKADTPAKLEVPAEDQWIADAIAERVAAKKAKNYAEADRIRAELSAKGVTLIDTKDGTTFKLN